MPAFDQFYTGLVAQAYAPLRRSPERAEPYRRFVQRYGEPALEIGCGHGEPLLELIGDGLDVTGLDSSADMLALARAAASERGLRVDLIHQSMETMQIDKQFSSIYFAGPTFQLVMDPAAALETLRRIAQHLTANGRALIPLYIPEPTERSELYRWHEHTTDTAEILAFQIIGESYRKDEHRVDSTLRYRRGPENEPIEIVDRIWSRCWYTEGEFESLAETAGLDIEHERALGQSVRSLILKRSN